MKHVSVIKWISIASTVLSLVALTSESVLGKTKPAKVVSKKHVSSQAKKKATVGEMLRGLKGQKGRGENVSIQKTFTSLPSTTPTKTANRPVNDVKPPSSSEMFRETGTDEEKLEQVTDQSVNELYKLTQQYKTSRNRGELWLRLAEAYVEKAKFVEYRLQKEYDVRVAKHLAGKGAKPKLDLTKAREYNVKAIKLYEWFLNDFPKDPKSDQALFFLGYNYIELDQVKKGIVHYTRLTQEHPASPYVSEAQFALGEYYFDNNKWKEGEKYYTEVLRNRRARLYTFALYKVAWCQYRQGRVTEGLRTLEKVVQLSRGQEKEGAPAGRRAVSRIRLASEALKDIVLFYGDAGNYREAKSYFLNVGGEKAMPPMMEKLAYYYSDSGKREPAMFVFKQLLEMNPVAPKAFDYQYQIVQNYQASLDQRVFRQELYLWVDNYGPESDWGRANKDNAKLIEDSLSLRESALRNYTLSMHKNAQNSGKKNEMIDAKSSYERYLKRFPQSAKNVEMHFFYAELLYSIGEYVTAAREYQYVAERDPQGKYHEDAVLNALLSLEKGLKSDEEIKRITGDKLEPVPFGDAENLFVSAADRYTKTFPKGSKRADARFKVGRLHYTFNHFDDALKVFQEIVAQYPRSSYGVYSANLILDIYNLRKDYDSIALEGGKFMNNHDLTSQGFETDVKDLVEKASFKKASDKEVARDFEGSAKAFADFSRSYPRSALATSATFNSAVNYERAHKIPEAIVMYKKVESMPGKKDDKVKVKSNLLVGRLYEQTGQFEKAAAEFERYAANNPKDPLAADLYFNAAIIWEGQKNINRAVRDFEEYQRLSRRKDRNAVFYNIAQMYDRQGSITKASEYYEKYLNTGGGNPERVLECQFRLASISEMKGHREESEKLFRRVIYSQKSFQEKGQNIGARYAAESKFKLVEKTYIEFVSIRIPADPKKQQIAVKDKLGLLAKLGAQYSEVIKYDDGNMVIASLTKLGSAYEHLKNAILKVPPPRDLTGKDLEAYQAGVNGLAKEQEKQAIQNFKSAVSKSYEINFYNEWTMASIKALQRLEPQNYHEWKEIVLPVQITDDMGLSS